MTAPASDEQATDYTIAAVDRAIILLEILGSLGPAGLARVAQEAGCTRTAAFRLLRTLGRRGFVVQDGPRGLWRLGARLTLLGQAQGAQGALAATAAPRLIRLAEEAREVVYLLGRTNHDVEILSVHQIDPDLYRYSEAGGRRPLHAGAGRLLLAMAPEVVQIQVLSMALPRFTAVTITNPRQLAVELRRIRERGWLITDNESEAGTFSINAPVRDAAGQVIASVAIIGPALRLRGNRSRVVLVQVIEAAKDVSRLLGWQERRNAVTQPAPLQRI